MFVLLKKIVHFSMWDQILIFDFAFGLVQDEPIKPFNTELPLPDPIFSPASSDPGDRISKKILSG
jgi:hypothetical protein